MARQHAPLALLALLGVSCAGPEDAEDPAWQGADDDAWSSPDGPGSERPDAPLSATHVAQACPSLSVSVADVLVGAELGDEAEVEVVLRNSCDTGEDLVLDAVSLDDLDGAFTVLEPDADEELVLAPGEERSLRFAFAPQGDFMHLGDVTLYSNDPMVPEAALLLVGLPQELVRAKSGAAPTADAGGLLQETTGSTHSLDGSGSSDPEGDPLTYRWSFLFPASGSALTNSDITDSTSVSASFVSDVDGQYRVRFVVSDGTSVDKDFKWVHTYTGTNSAPTADAGAYQSGSVGSASTLDGSGSSDPDGDPLSYQWTFKSVPGSSGLTNSDITDATTASPSFTPDAAGTYRLRLLVDDGVYYDKDFTNVDVCSGTNTAPQANAGADISATTGDSHSLDGSGSSDADGDTLTYQWTFQSVPSGSSLTNSDISGSTTATPSFTSDVDGEYRMRLVVADACSTDKTFMSVTTSTSYTYSFINDVQPMFDADCAVCHGGSSPSQGLDLETDAYDDIVNVASGQEPTLDFVEPGDSANSYLYQKVAGTASTGNQMPRGGTAWSASELAILETWIDEGAPDN